jgi:hypothetical protein
MSTSSALASKILSKISHVIASGCAKTTDLMAGDTIQYMSGKTRREHDLLGDAMYL